MPMAGYSFPFSARNYVFFHPEIRQQIDYLQWLASEFAACSENPGAACPRWYLPAFYPPGGSVVDKSSFVTGIPRDYTISRLALIYQAKSGSNGGIDPLGQPFSGRVGFRLQTKLALDFLTTLHKSYLARYMTPIQAFIYSGRRRAAHADELGVFANFLAYLDDCATSASETAPLG